MAKVKGVENGQAAPGLDEICKASRKLRKVNGLFFPKKESPKRKRTKDAVGYWEAKVRKPQGLLHPQISPLRLIGRSTSALISVSSCNLNR